MTPIPYTTIEWSGVAKTEHPGITGTATWQTLQWGPLRLRMVHYSANYLADHWCEKGHIVHCLEGEFITELSTGEKTILKAGNGYVVSDGMSSHRSFSEHGSTLLIVDGEFLNLPAN